MTTPTAEVIAQGTLTTILSTEMNSLATASYSSLGGAITNAQATANLNGYMYWDILLNLAAYTGTPAASSSVNLWFIPAVDGTNYDNSGTTISIAPNVIIPVDALASGPYQRSILGVLAPVGIVKPICYQNTGLTFAASGNTIKIRPTTVQAPSV